MAITSRKVNFILDADVRDFFGRVSQEWLVRFLEHRVGDKRIVRLIQRWLKAGVLEDGVVTVADRGTSRDRPLRLLRGSHQCPGALLVPALRDRPLAMHAPAA